MEIHTLLKELDHLDIPKDQYAITSSGPLAIRGIREAHDLDVIVTEDVWEQLAKHHTPQKKRIETMQIGNIEILGEGSLFTKGSIASVAEQIETADVISGHRFVNLQLIRKFKTRLGREKDLRDITLIDNYLASQN